LGLTDVHLTDIDGINYLVPQKAKITVLPEDALPHCPLNAMVWMLYEKRRIKSDGANYIEGLQQIDLVKDGEDVHEEEIVRTKAADACTGDFLLRLTKART
jgi:hypothetical protein